MRRALDWLDDRTGLIRSVKETLDRHIPGGTRWAYVFGTGLTITFLLQAVTGILLAFYYSPSTTDAWGSVWYIQNQLTLGWMVRGMHDFGTSLMVILCVCHLLQVFWYGAYKAPREVNWITGLVLLGLVLGFAITGHPLTWDQDAYWGTRTRLAIAATIPVVGDGIATFAQGGSDFGNFTLTRFYALHVLVLPVVTVAFIWLHVALHARHGTTPPASIPPEELDRKRDTFWPVQALRNLTFGLAIVALLMALALWIGAPLDAPADPASEYDARPEWFFLFLFQLLKYFEGPMMVMGTVVLPGIVSVFLLALPFLDKAPDRRIAARRLWAGLFFACFAVVVTLTSIAMWNDANSSDYKAAVARAQADGADAVRYAGVAGYGINARGIVVLFEGKKIFRREACHQCHESTAPAVEDKGPSLRGYHSRAYIRRFLKNPSHPKHFGNTKLADEMPETQVGERELDALVEFVADRSGEVYEPPIDPTLATDGAALFESGDCSGCHTLDGSGDVGPDLRDYGSAAWLGRLLKAPSHELMYGDDGDGMPPFDHLDAAEAKYLIGWLLYLRHETEIE